MARVTAATTSLTARLLFWVTVITAAALIGVVAAATAVARRALERQIARDAEGFARDVAFDLRNAEDPATVVEEAAWSTKLLQRLSLRDGLRGVQVEVTVGERSARLQALSSGIDPTGRIRRPEVPLGEAVARSAESHLEVLLRERLEGGEVDVRVYASTEVVQAFSRVIYRNAALFGLGTWLLLVVTIALFVYRTVTRPLQKVAGAMREVAAGHLRQSLDPAGAAEVEPLIGAFNTMSNRLAETELERSRLWNEVKILNQQLEQRVEQATAALAMAQTDLARRERLAAMGELVGTIAHEVGTPLNSVLAHLDLLQEDLAEPTGRERLEIAVREIERVSDVIRRYLRSTRTPSPEPEPVEMASMLAETVRIFESQAVSRNVGLEVVAGTTAVMVDRNLLAQIVHNLVSNALAAVGAGNSVRVSATYAEPELTLTVADDGIGMDSTTRELLFEPFYSARRDGKGTGLGMSIVRNAVATLGGRIAIDSAPGRGTTVTVIVPAEPLAQPAWSSARPSEQHP